MDMDMDMGGIAVEVEGGTIKGRRSKKIGFGVFQFLLFLFAF